MMDTEVRENLKNEILLEFIEADIAVRYSPTHRVGMIIEPSLVEYLGRMSTCYHDVDDATIPTAELFEQKNVAAALRFPKGRPANYPTPLHNSLSAINQIVTSPNQMRADALKSDFAAHITHDKGPGAENASELIDLAAKFVVIDKKVPEYVKQYGVSTAAAEGCVAAEKRVIEDVARDILLKYAAHRIIDFIRAPHNDQKLVLTNRHLHGARQTKEEQIQN